MLSPGPCTPNEAGICLDAHREGVGRPSRSSASASGTRRSARRSAARWCARRGLCTASCPTIRTTGEGVFRGINGPFKATRYHSLVVDARHLADELDVTAETDDGLVMGVAHAIAAGPWRAVSSRKHRFRARPPDPEELSRSGRRAGTLAGRRRRKSRRMRATDGRRLKALIAKAASGAVADARGSRGAFDRMMSGEATPSQMGGLLMALRVRGETVDEITGAVARCAPRCSRSKRRPKPSMWSAPAAMPRAPTTFRPAPPLSSPARACRSPSTATGRCPRNRAPPMCSPRSASRSICSPNEITRCISEAGIGFMFAPAHHPAMKHVGPTRVELGTRTIFNLLGPLSNPAGVKRQLVGVFSRQWVEPLAHVLKNLGSEACLGGAWLRRARRDHDLGPDLRRALENGKVRTFEITPEDIGLARDEARSAARRRRRSTMPRR